MLSTPLHKHRGGGVLRAVTCHISSILPSLLNVAQASRGVLGAVQCHKRGACTTEGEYISQVEVFTIHKRRSQVWPRLGAGS